MLPSLRQLQYLKLLAEHGSFSRAADAAHVSQPALSAGVQELERILGAPVVERARSGVILTAVGAEAVRRAEDVLARTEDLVEAARGAGKPLSGRFRLGVIPTVAPFLLPKALPELKRRWPALRLYLREDLTPRLIAALKSGALDAAVIALPYDTAGLDCARIGDDEIMAAAPTDHPWATGERVDPQASDVADLILLEDGHCLREHALSACALEPPKGEDVFAATSLHTLVQMVGSGLGVSFLPQMAVKAGLADGAAVAVRPLRGDAPKREIVVAWRAGSSRAREAELLAEAFRDV
ncbi:hydrogen peroxide-inducible genes activator [Caulobacter sp. 17J80-11]|uniref:hydrogen peroxide-inducible genes activator n=1 Tax=Caulobacter sp. 17J80-11 TaxID=2763502 RepID=UPI001653A0DC|nr:hydrogen peroxide-inducible genes activator [Caulobacter sp. 17J80-11]MBC6981527.1 hydrogen peroxide-inducible genes activator [Caulobacter sp. 17J80-11]